MISGYMAYNLDSKNNILFRLNGEDIRVNYHQLIEDCYNGQMLPPQSINARQAEEDIKNNMVNVVLFKFRDAFNPKIVICMMLKHEKLNEILRGALGEDDGMVYMLDNQNRILASAMKGVENENLFDRIDFMFPRNYQIINSKDGRMLVANFVSQQNGYCYVSVKNLDKVLESVSRIKNIILVILAISIIFSMIIVIYLTVRNGRSFERIMASLFDNVKAITGLKTSDPFDWLFISVSSMLQSNRKLSLDMENSRPYLLKTFIEYLIRNEFNSNEEIDNLCNCMGIKFSGNMYAVSILRLQKYQINDDDKISEKLQKQRQLIRELVNNKFNTKWKSIDVLLHNIDEANIIVLYAFSCDKKTFEETMEELYQLIAEFVPELQFGLGKPYPAISDISRSYAQAMQALSSEKSRDGKRLFFYWDIEQPSHSYYYPTDIESKIINCILGGDVKMLTTLIDKIEQENFRLKQLDSDMQRMFVLELFGTCIKLLDQCSLNTEDCIKDIQCLRKSVYEYNSTEAYQVLCSMLLKICKTEQHKKNMHNYLVDSVCKYIEKNYADSALGLSRIALDFNISEMYLSQMFKKQTGENLSVYLENVRMTKARKLLVETELTISEIAQAIGYSSANSFCRAFRRRHGINCTDYRVLNTQNEIEFINNPYNG